jgi:L-threonylcarbamoyladenylate synthase
VPYPTVLPADDREAVAAAAEVIRNGGLVALPTETVYGVACALDAAALEGVIAAKGRDATKGITLTIDAVEDAEKLARFPDAARRLARRFWPGPLTLVLPVRPEAHLPDALTGGGGRIGLRMPDHPTPRALARAVGPFPMTSANRSGDPAARTADEAVAAIGGALALVLDGGPVRGGVASTVVAVEPDGSLRVLRGGAIEREAIESAARG